MNNKVIYQNADCKDEKEASNYNGEYYQKGDVSEVLMYVRAYNFLLLSISTASEFILKNRYLMIYLNVYFFS